MMETPVTDSCKNSRLRLDRRLADAGGREECCRIYKSGFNEFARKILPELNGAAEKSGQNTPDYLHTRQIVVDHLTWLTSTCRCTCPDFVNCVQFFTRLDKGCKDRKLAKEIQKLGNWVHAEKAENKIGEKKRADLRARSESQILFTIGMVGLFFLSIAVFAWQQLSPLTAAPIVAAPPLPSPEVTARTQIEPLTNQVAAPTVSTAAPSPQPQAMPQKTTSSVDGIYRFTDAKGVIHFVASLNQVPAEYRSQMNFTQTQPLHTAVTIRGGRVLVPVELSNGHTVAGLTCSLIPAPRSPPSPKTSPPGWGLELNKPGRAQLVLPMGASFRPVWPGSIGWMSGGRVSRIQWFRFSPVPGMAGRVKVCSG